MNEQRTPTLPWEPDWRAWLLIGVLLVTFAAVGVSGAVILYALFGGIGLMRRVVFVVWAAVTIAGGLSAAWLAIGEVRRSPPAPLRADAAETRRRDPKPTPRWRRITLVALTTVSLATVVGAVAYVGSLCPHGWTTLGCASPD